jgi:hypothetical protein
MHKAARSMRCARTCCGAYVAALSCVSGAGCMWRAYILRAKSAIVGASFGVVYKHAICARNSLELVCLALRHVSEDRGSTVCHALHLCSLIIPHTST